MVYPESTPTSTNQQNTQEQSVEQEQVSEGSLTVSSTLINLGLADPGTKVLKDFAEKGSQGEEEECEEEALEALRGKCIVNIDKSEHNLEMCIAVAKKKLSQEAKRTSLLREIREELLEICKRLEK
jgi:hypothetical protein